jgi:hypothetical protein
MKNAKTRTPFSPEPGKIYELASPSGGRFYCESRPSGSLFNAWMVNVLSGWSFLAHGVGIYPDGRIDWDYSTDGRFTRFQLEGAQVNGRVEA